MRANVPFPLPWQCDQVMEFSWSALWNITDETPDNCEMFLNFSGMKLFLECLKVSEVEGCAITSSYHEPLRIPGMPNSNPPECPLSICIASGGQGQAPAKLASHTMANRLLQILFG